jgi:outer membrane receptor protein involved in Fe transport
MVRDGSGWSASLFVANPRDRDTPDGVAARVRSMSFVNAQLTRRLTKTARVSFDVFNVFDKRAADFDYFSASAAWSRPGSRDDFLFHPAEPRGFRLSLRVTF